MLLLVVTDIYGAVRTPRTAAAEKDVARPGVSASTADYFKRKGGGRRSYEASVGEWTAEGGKSATGALCCLKTAWHLKRQCATL